MVLNHRRVPLLGAHVLAGLSPSARSTVISRSLLPHVISAALRDDLRCACDSSVLCWLLGAFTSSLRGGKFDYRDPVHTPHRSSAGGAHPGVSTTGILADRRTPDEAGR